MVGVAQAARVDEAAKQLGRHVGLTAVYGLAHFGKSLFWHSGDFLLAFFLTEVAGLPPIAMGGVLAVSLLVGAVLDVAIGGLCAHRLSNARSAAGLQLEGAILGAGAALALFAVPLVGTDMRLAYALAAALAFRASYSLHDVPQNALLSLATPDDKARTRVAAVRVGASGLAALTLAAGVMPLLAARAFTTTGSRILLFMALGAGMAIIAVASAALLRRAFRSFPGGASQKTKTVAASHRDLPRGLAPILGMIFIFMLTVPLFGKLESYFIVYGLRSPTWGAVMGGAGVAGMISTPLLWTRSLERLPRPGAVAALSLALVTTMLVFGFIGQSPFAACACAFALGSAGGAINLLLWAALGDAAARADPARVGLIYGLFTGASKTALAVGAVVLGGLLSQVDYRSDGGEALVRLMAGAPAVGAAACLVMAVLWDAAGRLGRRDIVIDPT